jgi:hypothetical protein
MYVLRTMISLLAVIATTLFPKHVGAQTLDDLNARFKSLSQHGNV